MVLNKIGQRCMSEPEPELGLGIVVSIDRHQVGISFPATGEQRIYASDTTVLNRVQFREGETINTKEGESIVIEAVEEVDGLLVYLGNNQRVQEDKISDVSNFTLPQERLMKGQTDPIEVFDLRLKTLQSQCHSRQSDVRGFLGGRVDLIPHQFYILKEVSTRQIPRVLLSDEVGLGKTIEACLILQRLLVIGKVKRALILVPESLIHQWFVELLRRFNLWFSIFDDARCKAAEQSNPEGNPFLDQQLALSSVSFLTDNEIRQNQAVEAGWDMVVVDEAHHLEWTPKESSPEYEMVERLAQNCHGLLLLTATPNQLGLEGHFARLRLLDSDRYNDFDQYLEEAEDFGLVAEITGKIIDNKALTKNDHASLKKIFNKNLESLNIHLEALASKKSGAKEALIKSLLDEHGTGRVVFRNSRANMKGFPKRKFCPVPLEIESKTILNRMCKELEAEAADKDDSIRYSFKDDPRIDWLAEFLKKNQSTKVLLICRSQRKVMAIEAALLTKINVKIGLFHENLPLVSRDRNAAWFAEKNGAQLLICSEIGSEGRNFQFAHHLVLFDIPLNPGLVEQRIGRLDRIGQTETIKIHLPYVVGSCQEFVVKWYHEGLNALETPLHGGNECQVKFEENLLKLALDYDNKSKKNQKLTGQFIEDTIKFRKELTKKLSKGRDRLLEINSYNEEVAQNVIGQIREAESDSLFKVFLCDLMDHFGVRIVEHEDGDVFLDPSHAYVEAFPSISQEGDLVTFDRKRATTREDIIFITPDHPLYWDSMDLMINSKTGTTSFGHVDADDQGILLEAIFILESVAQNSWHVEQFLAPAPIRVVVDLSGNELTEEWDTETLNKNLDQADIYRFLERPEFTEDILKTMIDTASEFADVKIQSIKNKSIAKTKKILGSDIQRLLDLRKINDHVKIEEIELSQNQLNSSTEAIENARLRLDSIRLIVFGDQP